MRALVTGATGFIGSHLVVELQRRGWEIICVVRKPVKPTLEGIRYIVADLAKPASLNFNLEQTRQLDTIFHVGAALPTHEPPPSTMQYLMTNMLATVQLLEIATTIGARSFVYVSGVAVVGKPKQVPITEDHSTQPLHPYLLSKLCAEQACELVRRTTSQYVTSLRITSPYGPGMPTKTVLPRFIQQALRSQDLQWSGSGQRTQNFVHVTDVVQSCLLAADTPHPGVYNVAGESSITMKALAELILSLTPESGSRARPSGDTDAQEDYRWDIDLTRAASCLHYSPRISLANGLREYIAFTRDGEKPRLWWLPE